MDYNDYIKNRDRVRDSQDEKLDKVRPNKSNYQRDEAKKRMKKNAKKKKQVRHRD